MGTFSSGFTAVCLDAKRKCHMVCGYSMDFNCPKSSILRLLPSAFSHLFITTARTSPCVTPKPREKRGVFSCMGSARRGHQHHSVPGRSLSRTEGHITARAEVCAQDEAHSSMSQVSTRTWLPEMSLTTGPIPVVSVSRRFTTLKRGTFLNLSCPMQDILLAPCCKTNPPGLHPR